MPGKAGARGSLVERRQRAEIQELELAPAGAGAAADLTEGLGVRRSGPFAAIEALSEAAELPVAGFAAPAGVPERTYRRRLARLRG